MIGSSRSESTFLWQRFSPIRSEPIGSPHPYQLTLGTKTVNQTLDATDSLLIEASDWSVYNLQKKKMSIKKREGTHAQLMFETKAWSEPSSLLNSPHQQAPEEWIFPSIYFRHLPGKSIRPPDPHPDYETSSAQTWQPLRVACTRSTEK